MPKPRCHQPPIGPRAIREAEALHRQGRLIEAERIYAAIVACMPDHFDALHLLGVLRQEQNRPAEALSLIAAALRLNARSAQAHTNYGVVLCGLGRHAEALESFERALAIDPDRAETLGCRGDALLALGRDAAAQASYRAALKLDPADARARARCHHGATPENSCPLTPTEVSAEALPDHKATSRGPGFPLPRE
jgi:tetratricopeptide (TPR) repeat protein